MTAAEWRRFASVGGLRQFERNRMNDAHDNTADDKAMLNRIETDYAIEAFRALALKEFQQELKEYALTKTLRGHVNIDRYVDETEKIRRAFEDKREDAIRRGLLPRD
jgi:hypothetical protein